VSPARCDRRGCRSPSEHPRVEGHVAAGTIQEPQATSRQAGDNVSVSAPSRQGSGPRNLHQADTRWVGRAGDVRGRPSARGAGQDEVRGVQADRRGHRQEQRHGGCGLLPCRSRGGRCRAPPTSGEDIAYLSNSTETARRRERAAGWRIVGQRGSGRWSADRERAGPNQGGEGTGRRDEAASGAVGQGLK